MVPPFNSSKQGHNAAAGRSVLSLTSPAKLNVLSQARGHQNKITKLSLRRTNSLNISSFNASGKPNKVFGILPGSQSTSHTSSATAYSRPKIAIPNPPLLRRNSSFFKDDYPSSLSKLSTPALTADNQSSRSLIRQDSLYAEEQSTSAPTTDRFFPTLQNKMQNKIDPNVVNEEAPSPNASPILHLRAQTKQVFKQNVAVACGLEMNQRILEYMPPPPLASFNRKTYSLGKRTHYNYSQLTNQAQQQQQAGLIKLRKVNTNPERILDAPGFQDNFYLNLLSWSHRNILAIALESSLYLWNGDNGDVTLLTEYANTMITSVTWSDDDCHISIGKEDGTTEIWDTETMSLVRTMNSSTGVRIGSQSWLETLIATGCRSGEIQINDVRLKNHVITRWEEHTAEVCGLSYKKDGLQLASGGNDNTVMIWDTRTSMPQFIKRNHTAAVKALSWCPYMPNVLATGGGQTDKQIIFWNSITGAKLGAISTGSQVSSLHWGQTYSHNSATDVVSINREIVATGGSPGNSISVYNYDTKYKVAEIDHAHESRICTSQLSPDGTILATVGGDENLKFYKIFETKKRRKHKTKSIGANDVLNLFGRSSSNLSDARSKLITSNDDDNISSANKQLDSDSGNSSGASTPNGTPRAAERRTREFLIR